MDIISIVKYQTTLIYIYIVLRVTTSSTRRFPYRSQNGMNEEDDETSVKRQEKSPSYSLSASHVMLRTKGKNYVYKCVCMYIAAFSSFFSDRLSLWVKYPTEQDAFINSLSSRQFGKNFVTKKVMPFLS